MTWKLTVAMLSALVLPACDAGGPPVQAEQAQRAAASGAPAPTAAGGAVKKNSFGTAITETNQVALTSIAQTPADYANKVVKTTGTIKAVCQTAGCWMEIQDETSRAHIKMSGHSFYVPKDASGRRAVVQGTVQAGEAQDTCGAKDACGGTDNGAIAKLEIVATGVELLD